ncbi:hypothetical protein IC582_029407 [Cucumis melo]
MLKEDPLCPPWITFFFTCVLLGKSTKKGASLCLCRLIGFSLFFFSLGFNITRLVKTFLPCLCFSFFYITFMYGFHMSFQLFL